MQLICYVHAMPKRLHPETKMFWIWMPTFVFPHYFCLQDIAWRFPINYRLKSHDFDTVANKIVWWSAEYGSNFNQIPKLHRTTFLWHFGFSSGRYFVASQIDIFRNFARIANDNELSATVSSNFACKQIRSDAPMCHQLLLCCEKNRKLAENMWNA